MDHQSSRNEQVVDIYGVLDGAVLLEWIPEDSFQKNFVTGILMRKVHSPQMSIGQVNISDIEIDLRSRDDIPQILLGLKHIYTTPPLREAVFKILEEVVPYQVGNDEQDTGQHEPGSPGYGAMGHTVLGLLRLGLDTDFDRIHELANQHRTIRQMLGHGAFDEEKFLQFRLHSGQYPVLTT